MAEDGHGAATYTETLNQVRIALATQGNELGHIARDVTEIKVFLKGLPCETHSAQIKEADTMRSRIWAILAILLTAILGLAFAIIKGGLLP